MNNHRYWKMRLQWMMALAIALMAVLASGGCSVVKTRPGDLSKDEVPVEAAQMRQKLTEALATARQSGQTTVTLNLAEDPLAVQVGDLVVLEGIARLTDNSVIWSSDADQPYAPGNQGSDAHERGEEPVVAGERTTIPGLSTEIIGMAAGDTRTVILTPEHAFGDRNPDLLRRLPLVKHLPREIRVPADSFEDRFGSPAEVGAAVTTPPYVSAMVTSIEDNTARVIFSAEDGKIFPEEFGTVTVATTDDRIDIILDPVIGAPFIIDQKKGFITASDDRFFTVDLNHPLAGETIILDVTVHTIVKASQLDRHAITWEEDFDTGMERSAQEEKPSVLVLYAGWCQWSKRLLNESLMDPRVTYLSDRFVWIKVDSDKERGLKEMFEQESFPTVVVMDPVGDVRARLDGFQTPLAIGKILQQVLLAMEHN